MKIAYILPSLAKMGPTLVAYDLATSMLQRGHEVCVYYFDELRENTVKFPCPTLRISFRHRFDMEKFDVVHSHMLRPDLYIWLYRPCRKNTHTRFITTIHSFVMQDLTSMYNRLVAFIFGNLWMLLLHCFDMRVVLSNEAKHYYLRWFRSEQLTCVYNTRTLNCEKKLTEDERKELMDFRGDMPLLGVNALLSPIKGIDLIIRAMSFIDNVRLWVVGNGKSLIDLQTLAKQLGVEDRIHFAGYKEDAFRYLPFYDLYMMTSRSEGFPLAMLEAVIMKRNIVCSDIGVFNEIFTSDEVTFFHIEDVQSLVNAIKIALLHDKSEAAYQHYLQSYSPKTFADGYEQIYYGYK